MTTPVKIQLTLDPDIERALRVYLATIGRGRKGQLSTFFEELITTHLSAWARAAIATETPAGTEIQPPSPGLISAPKPDAHAGAAPTRPAPPPLAAPLTPADLARLVDAASRWQRAG